MCREIKLLYCIRISDLSLVTFDTGEYLGGKTEAVSEISSGFGYLLDAKNQLLVLGNCLKTLEVVVAGPASSLMGRALRRECVGFLHVPSSLQGAKPQVPRLSGVTQTGGHRKGLQQEHTLLLGTKRWLGQGGQTKNWGPSGTLCAGVIEVIAMTGSISDW